MDTYSYRQGSSAQPMLQVQNPPNDGSLDHLSHQPISLASESDCMLLKQVNKLMIHD